MATNSINSIKTRIIHKHDTEANWEKAENFIPLQGEIIIYDKDDTHPYERIKIGDGSTKVNALPFIDAPDDALSETSSNTVKNSVIYAALETKVTRNADTEDFTTSIHNTIKAHSAALANIEEGAQVNQKAFSTIAVKASSTATATNIAADTTTDTLTLIAGDNVTLTPGTSSTTDQITISAKDTTYSNATSSKAGLMSSTDKGDLTAAVAKLADIEEGAQVNQKAFSTIAVKSSSSATAQNITADTVTDTLTLIAGSNITLTPNTTSDQITISATDTKLALDTNLATSGKAADAKAVGDKFAELIEDIEDIGGDFDALSSKVNTLLDSDDTTLDQTKEIVTYIKNNKSLIDNITTSKQNTITGGATTITSSDLTKDRALISNSSGKVAVSAVTSTELGYLDGVTSGIQSQLNTKASSDDLAALGDSVHQENYNLARRGIKIEANTDLDSLTTPGHYYSPNADNTNTLLNCPAPSGGFRLLVSSNYGDGGTGTNYMRQIIFNSTSSKIFTRLKNTASVSNGAWRSWQTIITSENPGDFLNNINQDNFWDAIVAPGGKITGSFYLGNSATAPKIYFKPTNFNDEVMGSIQYNAEADSTRSRYRFLQYSRSSSDYSKVSFYEAYSLPSVDPDRTEHGGYSILTSKNKVTLAQGGTGSNLSGIPAGAVVRNSSNDSGLWYTPTKKGAFYASEENGLPSFGTLPVGMGGTGTATAPTKGGVIYASSTSAYASTAAGSSGQVLISNGANAPSWTSQANLSVGSATSATSATTATKLSTSAGSTTLPVYFKDGKPAAVSSVRIGSSTAGTYADFLVNRKNSADAAYAQGYMAVTSSAQNLQLGYTHFSADGTKDVEISLYFSKTALRHSVDTSTSTDNAPTLGLSTNKWRAVYADKFVGTADKANMIPVSDTEPETESDYFIAFVGNKTANTYYAPRANNGLMYRTVNGTTTTAGLARLYLGNSKSSTTEGNKKGDLVLYSTGTKYIRITPAETSTSNHVITLPAKTGTVALTSELPTVSTGRSTDGFLTITLNGTDYIARSPYLECYGTVLAENTDLNTIKTPGIRYSSGKDRSATLANTPLTTSGFRLFTHTGYGSASSYGIQEIIGSQQRFWRSMGLNNESPSDWWVVPRIKANTQVGSAKLPVYISEAGMVYAITNLELPGTLTVTGTSTLNTTAYLKGNTYAYNKIYFRNDASDINSINGFGAYSSGRGGAVANSNYLIVDSEGNYACRWQLRAYSIDSSTGQALTKSQYYVFPNTPTDLTSDILATVITNKNPNDLLSSSLSQTSFWNAIVAPGGFMTGIISLKNSEQYPQLHFQPSFSSTPIFKIYGSAGSATAFKQGAYAWFRLYSFTDGATSTSSYYEDYRLPSVNVGLTGTKGYNILTTKPLSSNILYRKYDKDSSSASNVITWYKNDGTTVQHMLGAHNTGNTYGAVYIIPYTPTSGVDTWSGTEGLYIGKTKFTWESKTIYHTGNIITCSNTDEITSPTEGMIALIVS